MCDPAVFLETARLFALPTPMGLFLPSQQPLRQSSKLPALRAVVFAKVRARHLGFLLLSCRGVQNLSILPVSVFPTFAAFPLSTEPAALGFGRISRSPARRRNVRFFASGGHAPGCARKTGHSRDTRLTLVDGRFPAAPVGTLPTAFGCVPAHIPCPALQAFARKTAGWRTEWAGACTEGSHFAFGRPA